MAMITSFQDCLFSSPSILMEHSEPTTETTYNEILKEILIPQVKQEVKWIIRGIIGLSIFFICLGILGVVAVIKSIFL